MRSSTRFTDRVRAAIRRLRRLFAELDYSQRRLLEIRTGRVLSSETEHAIVRGEIDRLNALYEAEDHTAAIDSSGAAEAATPIRSAVRPSELDMVAPPVMWAAPHRRWPA